MQILKIAEGKQFNGVQLIGSIPEYMGEQQKSLRTLGLIILISIWVVQHGKSRAEGKEYL